MERAARSSLAAIGALSRRYSTVERGPPDRIDIANWKVRGEGPESS